MRSWCPDNLNLLIAQEITKSGLLCVVISVSAHKLGLLLYFIFWLSYCCFSQLSIGKHALRHMHDYFSYKSPSVCICAGQS